MTGATESEIAAAQRSLGLDFPTELRDLLLTSAGEERWCGEWFFMVYGVEAVVAANQEITDHEGLVVFASDGSRELFGLDLRTTPSPVVMIDITSAGWSDAIVQAPTLRDFLDQRDRGEDFRWA